MIEVYEGVDKRDVIRVVERLRGSGAIPLTSPKRRVLDASRTLVAGFDWAAATWDAATNELYCLFDATLAALSTPGIYFVQLCGTIGDEVYAAEETVRVKEWGP